MKRSVILLLVIIMLVVFAGPVGAYEFAVTIPDDYTIRTRDAICGLYGYDTNKEPGETMKQFCERMSTKHFFRRSLQEWEEMLGKKIYKDEWRAFRENLQTELDAAWE